MPANGSWIAVVALVFASSCSGTDHKNAEVNRTCQCFQTDGGVSTIDAGPIVFCDMMPEEALRQCQGLSVPTGCVSPSTCTCTAKDYPYSCYP